MGYAKPESLRGKHKTEGFDCGEEELNIWLVSPGTTR
jgi:hypothetical protein